MAGKKVHKKPLHPLKNQVAGIFPLTDRKSSIMLLLIVLVSFLAYLPIFQNSFVNWDESLYIRDNPLIQSFKLGNIFSTYQLGNYHPLTMLVYAIEYKIFGVHEMGYHAVNLLLHLTNVVLVFYVILLLCEKNMVALTAALLFGIHPIHVESVAWAAELKDLLYTLFFLASLICYIRFSRDGGKKYYLYSLLFFLLSILSKAMAASLPALLILTDYFLGKKINGKSLLEKVPFIILSIILGIVAVMAQRESGATDIAIYPFAQRVVFACYGFVTYFIKLILPLNLSAYYPYPIKEGAELPAQYYIYLLAFAALLVYVIYSIRFSKKIIFGIGFFSITVFLVLQLLPVGGAIMADRYAYIPSIGIFYLAGEGFYWLWNRNKYSSSMNLPGVLILTIAIIFFSVKTYSRCAVWKNPFTLWTSVIEDYPQVAMAYSNRGLFLAEENKFEEAKADMDKAVELVPELSKIYLNRALVFMYLNKYKEALDDYNKAIQLDPFYAEAYNNRGMLFKDERKFDNAIKDYSKAIELKPDLSPAYSNRGFALMYQNKLDAALADYNKAIELNEENAEAYNNRGTLYTYLKKSSEANDDLDMAIKLLPEYSQAYFNRGNLFMNEKKDEEAYDDFSKAIELDSMFTDAYLNRAAVLQNMNRLEEALQDCDIAIQIEPGFSQAYYNRGLLLIKMKMYADATNDLSKSLEMEPGNALAYYNRGIAEYFSGNKTAACTDIGQAANMNVPNAKEMFNKFCR